MLNDEKLQGFLHKMVGEIGAAATGSLVLIGDRLADAVRPLKHGGL
jgi:hypothetical protein